MVTPMFSEQDYELLSAYLDNMLTEQEIAALQARLDHEAPLLAELSALRATVALVKGLPLMKAPRNFTLTPSMVEAATLPALSEPEIVARRPQPRIIRFSAVSLLSAAASFIFIVLGLVLVLSSSESNMATDMSVQPSSVAGLSTDLPTATLAIAATMPLETAADETSLFQEQPQVAPPVAGDQPPTEDETLAEMADDADTESAAEEAGVMQFSAPTIPEEELTEMAEASLIPPVAMRGSAEGEAGGLGGGSPGDYPQPQTAQGEFAGFYTHTPTPPVTEEEAVQEVDGEAMRAMVGTPTATLFPTATLAPTELPPAPTDDAQSQRDIAQEKTETPDNTASLGLILLVVGGAFAVVAGIALFFSRRRA